MARKDTAFMQSIKSDSNRLFISQDVIALEPSITAELSQDHMYMYATLNGIGQRPYYDGTVLMIDDIYLMSASVFPPTRMKLWEIFHEHTMPTGLSFADQWVVDSEVCKDYTKKAVRNFAKVACLGIGYGMGAKKFRVTAEENGTALTYKEAKATIDAYWELFKGLKALRDTLSWGVKRTKAQVNPFGYRSTPDDHKAMNAYIQSSASGVLDVYCLKLFAICDFAEFIALIHDEVILSIPEGMQERFKLLSDQAVESLNKDLGWSVPIRFGTKIADNFGGMK
jgi:hypothetical protein